MPVFFKPVFDFFPFFCPFPSQTVEEPKKVHGALLKIAKESLPTNTGNKALCFQGKE